jgi:hypothetical protein
MPYPLTRTGTYRTMNKLHVHACIIHDCHNQWIMPRQVFSIANKRIRLTREDVCVQRRVSILAIATPCEVDPMMTMAYTVDRFSIRSEDWACGIRASTLLINIDRSPGPGLAAPSVCIFCWQDQVRQETGRVCSTAICHHVRTRHSHLYLCLLLPCWIKLITNMRLIHVLGYICKHCSKTLRSRDLL